MPYKKKGTKIKTKGWLISKNIKQKTWRVIMYSSSNKRKSDSSIKS